MTRSFYVLVSSIILTFCLALATVCVRVKVTVLGYELGNLKAKERSLMERRSALQKEYAHLTSYKQLLNRITKNQDSSQKK